MEDLITWYQKKIGKYDNQPWEKAIEEWIFYGLSHIPFNPTKPKKDLIDLDLVRGSSFTKAKPKHGFLTVTRLSILRALFLPLYAKWWIDQTSGRIFSILFLVYTMLALNFFIYFTIFEAENVQSVPCSEILVPLLMLWVISYVHSQIVATSPSTVDSAKLKSKSRKIYSRRASKRSNLRKCNLNFSNSGYESSQWRPKNRSRSFSVEKNVVFQQNDDKVSNCDNGNQESRHRIVDEGFDSFNGSGSSPSIDGDLKIQQIVTEIDNDLDLKDHISNPWPELIQEEGNGAINEAIETEVLKNNACKGKVSKKEAIIKETSNNKHVSLGLSFEALQQVDSDFKTMKNNDFVMRAPKNEASINSSSINLSSKIITLEDEAKSLFNDTTALNQSPNDQTLVEVSKCKAGNDISKRIPIDDDGFESFAGNGSSPNSEYGEFPFPATSSLNNKQGSRETFKDDHIHFTSLTSDDNDEADSPRLSKSLKGHNKNVRSILSRRRTSYRHCDSDSEDKEFLNPNLISSGKISTFLTDQEDGECETISSRETNESHLKSHESTLIGLTTNSEDCSYNSDISESDTQSDVDAPPNFILSPLCGPSHRVSCTLWDHNEVKKADLSVIEISSVIIGRVETTSESLDCFLVGIFLTTILSILPIICRFCYNALDCRNEEEMHVSIVQISGLVFDKFSASFSEVLDALLGTDFWERVIITTAAVQRWTLSCFLFFLLAVAERTFKQRFLYAKLFSHLTSSRRARKSGLPHFRLNKVRNIKTWLSVRSYLRKRGPQRSVEVIVSAAFVVTLLLLSFMCMELLKESFVLNSQYNLEILIWSVSLGMMILRFMTLGVKINKKYRNLSVLITEQINLYLQIEQKPNKKEELMVANSVLKLAADLLKELESEFKILGLSANPVFYNITKVVILSALSGVLSEILGFKLKLHKIKIK